jgi:cytosolic carboxypeptidase protein 2/3
MGARFHTSIAMHKKFANQPVPSGCDCPEEQAEENPSYKFAVTKVLPYKEEQKEKPRDYVGMDPGVNTDTELTFDSTFESGNLDLVIKPAQDVYDLFMRVDTNTKGHH